MSTLFQCCLLVDMTSRCGTTSNQSLSNVVYFNVGIYNVKQCRINVVYFNVDVSNVMQRWNNVFLFNVECHNVGQRGSYVVNMTISKRNKKIISTWIHCIYSYYCYFMIFFTLLPILRRIRWRILANLRIMKNTALQELDLNGFTL